MSNYYDQGFQWVWSNYQYFADAKGIIYQGDGQPLSKWWGSYNPSGFAKVKKTSGNTTVTTSNSSYSLEGAEYSVYSNAACSSRVGTLKTDANGNSGTLKLNAGTYYVKYKVSGDALYTTAKGISALPLGTVTIQETKAPEGYTYHSIPCS